MWKAYKPTEHDWPEDFPHENGNYENKCGQCSATFFGYKRRMTCKACVDAMTKFNLKKLHMEELKDLLCLGFVIVVCTLAGVIYYN